jgi:hypothetical protein
MPPSYIVVFCRAVRRVLEKVVLETAHHAAVIAREKDQRVFFQLQLLQQAITDPT